MAEPFLSEIRIMSFGYAPRGWAQCNGQLLPINQNQALFSLLGTVYGGNGPNNFALPDLRGNVPTHAGACFTLGQKGGQQAHTLTQSEMPAHNHIVSASSVNGNSDTPQNTLFAQALNVYRGAADSATTLSPATISNVGGSQAHINMQPYLTVKFCIALQGIFPSPN